MLVEVLVNLVLQIHLEMVEVVQEETLVPQEVMEQLTLVEVEVVLILTHLVLVEVEL